MNEYQINGESLNIVSENIEKLKQIFPEVVCEDQINFDMLEEILTGGGEIAQVMIPMKDTNLHGRGK